MYKHFAYVQFHIDNYQNNWAEKKKRKNYNICHYRYYHFPNCSFPRRNQKLIWNKNENENGKKSE